jgi:hypothetical protein
MRKAGQKICKFEHLRGEEGEFNINLSAGQQASPAFAAHSIQAVLFAATGAQMGFLTASNIIRYLGDPDTSLVATSAAIATIAFSATTIPRFLSIRVTTVQGTVV